MRMRKRQFRIGELAKALGVERFVVRFWEKEFGIKSHRSPGGQRFYEEKDLETFKLIKKLLYEQKYTIAGAKRELKGASTHVIASQKTSLESAPPSDEEESFPGDVSERIVELQKRLVKLREML